MPRYEIHRITTKFTGHVYDTKDEAHGAISLMQDTDEYIIKTVLNPDELQALQTHLSPEEDPIFDTCPNCAFSLNECICLHPDEAQNIEDKRLADEDNSPYGGAMYCQG